MEMITDASMESKTQTLVNIPERIEDADEIFQKLLTEQEQATFLKLDQEQLNEFKETFDIFDDNGDGTIDYDEIVKVMQGLGENASISEIKAMTNEIDFDQNGVVDFIEFVCLMTKTLTKKQKMPEELV